MLMRYNIEMKKWDHKVTFQWGIKMVSVEWVIIPWEVNEHKEGKVAIEDKIVAKKVVRCKIEMVVMANKAQEE